METIDEIFQQQGLEDIAKHCLRYGKIVEDDSAEFVKGHWRRYVIEIDGKRIFIMKENGNTTGAAIL
jgi:hypothetical protein